MKYGTLQTITNQCTKLSITLYLLKSHMPKREKKAGKEEIIKKRKKERRKIRKKKRNKREMKIGIRGKE